MTTKKNYFFPPKNKKGSKTPLFRTVEAGPSGSIGEHDQTVRPIFPSVSLKFRKPQDPKTPNPRGENYQLIQIKFKFSWIEINDLFSELAVFSVI